MRVLQRDQVASENRRHDAGRERNQSSLHSCWFLDVKHHAKNLMEPDLTANYYINCLLSGLQFARCFGYASVSHLAARAAILDPPCCALLVLSVIIVAAVSMWDAMGKKR